MMSWRSLSPHHPPYALRKLRMNYNGGEGNAKAQAIAERINHMNVPSSFWIDLTKTPGPVLDTASRVNEILFGLIMVLTFTGTLSVATQGKAEIAAVLWGALGCNVAWGLIDGIFFLLGTLMSRGENLIIARSVHGESTDQEADELVKGSLNPLLAALLSREQVANIREEVRKLPAPPPRAFLTGRDVRGAASIFALVFLSTFPPLIPFIFFHDAEVALRVSNGIALILLFTAGCILGSKAHWNPWLVGFSMMFFGTLLVAFTIALGG